MNVTGLWARPCFVMTVILEVATLWGTMATRLAGEIILNTAFVAANSTAETS